MRKLESLKLLKSLTNSKHVTRISLDNFHNEDVYFHLWYDNENLITVNNDRGIYYLSVNGITASNFEAVFSEKFARQVFEACQTIYLESEGKKND